MRYVLSEKTASGAYAAIADVAYSMDYPLWIPIDEACDITAFYTYRGFVNLQIDYINQRVIAVTPDEATYNAYMKEHPDTPQPARDPDIPEVKILQEDNIALKQTNKLLTAQLAAATDRQDFIEGCIAEIAEQVYAQ